MEIAVHPDGAVVVKAPDRVDSALIEKKVVKKARWILRHLNYFRQFNPKPPARCYVNGETHLYLGKQYRLKLMEGSKNSVKLHQGFFYITCNGRTTPEKAKKLLNQWYAEKAGLQFDESMNRCLRKFKFLNIDKPEISIKQMRKRWGSLSGGARITLNIDLVRAPKECIDYVVMHELCHMKYHDHGPEFYKLLDLVAPGWKKLKHKLELSFV